VKPIGVLSCPMLEVVTVEVSQGTRVDEVDGMEEEGQWVVVERAKV
jgi:hypothetical protein